MNACQAMDKPTLKKLPSNKKITEKRILLEPAESKDWPKIASSIKVLGVIDPTKKDYRCHHFALEKILKIPQHLRFSTNDNGMPIEFVNKYFNPTNTPKKNDLVQYVDKNLYGYRVVTHFAIFEDKKKHVSKWGNCPEIVQHAPKHCPASYGNENAFYTLKDIYKSDVGSNIFLQDIEQHKAKYILHLNCLGQILPTYEDSTGSLNCSEFPAEVEDYYSFLHDYNTTLDKIYQYPLSEDERQKINQFLL